MVSRRRVLVSTACLNQWSLDFAGNKDRIYDSIRQAHANGSTYRLGPELETTGYSCQDHFCEPDLIDNSWAVISAILPIIPKGLLVDIGAPVMHKGRLFNCRIFMTTNAIHLIRPKSVLADSGNYTESRWFSAWDWGCDRLDQFRLPDSVATMVGTSRVPMGIAVIEGLCGTTIAAEICEELWSPVPSPHTELFSDGIDIVSNGSASHFEIGKFQQRVHLIQHATTATGGAYMYSNLVGCDGDRLVFDGGGMVSVNGDIVTMPTGLPSPIGIDVEVQSTVIDLDDIDAYRLGGFGRTCGVRQFQRILIGIPLATPCGGPAVSLRITSHPNEYNEATFGPIRWLWDYLRRSGFGGLFISLSGGADSATVLALCACMCRHVVAHTATHPNGQIANDLRHILRLTPSTPLPTSAGELTGLLVHTAYMATDCSSDESRRLAAAAAGAVGASHREVHLQGVIDSFINATQISVARPQFLSQGGTSVSDDIALQNLQARSRMVTSYLLSQLSERHLLVLGTANADESLAGYMTKYDCSSADINPIGSLSKSTIRMILNSFAEETGSAVFAEIARATPSAELRPAMSGHRQTDEGDLAMSYDDLSLLGRIRKVNKCGQPVGMFAYLTSHEWRDEVARVVAEKVKRFFTRYGVNRHKMATLTPSVHLDRCSPDDNRFDQRPLLYPDWGHQQFVEIDRLINNSLPPSHT